MNMDPGKAYLALPYYFECFEGWTYSFSHNGSIGDFTNNTDAGEVD